MIRLFVFLGGLLVLALLAALVAPPFIDWNQFRDRFEREATRIVGQPVSVRGETTARLLPLPSVTFNDVHVGGEEPILSAKTFHITMELAPLMRGNVVIVDMNMDRPRFDLRVDAEGKLDWGLDGTQSATQPAASSVQLENITVTRGAIRLRDARYQREFILRNIAATASARSLAGPWRASGELTHMGGLVRFSGSTGTWQNEPDKPARVRLRLEAEPQELPYDVTFDGPLVIDNGTPKATGLFTVTPRGKQSPQDRISFPRPSVADAVDGVVQGSIELAADGAVIPAFELEVGDRADPYKIDGSAFARFGETLSFEINAEGQQVDIAQLGANTATGETANASPTSLPERVAAIRSVLEGIPRFDAKGLVKLALPALVAGDTVIRDLELETRPLVKGTGWRIAKLKAQLPGRTELKANGVLTLGREFGYEGSLTVASRQPSGFARWLVPDVPAPIRNLRAAGFTALAKVTPQELDLADLEIVLGSSQLLGSFNRKAKTETTPAKITADLRGDDADLDRMAALFDLFAGQRGAAVSHEIEASLDVKSLRVVGVAAQGVDAAIGLADGNLTVERADIENVLGAKLSLSGGLSDVYGDPSGTLTGSLVSQAPQNLLSFVQQKYGPFPLIQRFIDDPVLIADTDLSYTLSAGDRGVGMRLAVKGQSGGSAIDTTLSSAFPGSFAHLRQNPLDLQLSLQNDIEAQLLAQLNIPALPIDIAGTATFSAALSGVPENALQTRLDWSLADVTGSATGRLTPVIDGGDLTLLGDLTINAATPDADNVVFLSGLAIPGFGNGFPASLETEASFTNGEVRLSQLKLTAVETDLSGDLTINHAATPRPRVTGSLTVPRLDAAIFAQLVHPPNTGEADSAPASLLSGLDGQIAVRAGEVISPLPELPNAQNAQADLILSDGDLTLDAAEANWNGGRLLGDLTLGRSGGSKLFNGSIQAETVDVQPILRAAGLKPSLSGTLNAGITLEATAPLDGNLVSGLTGSGTASLSEGRLDGLNDGAFPAILASTDDATDQDIGEIDLAGLRAAGLFDGTYRFGDAQTSFTVASGVLRANNVQLGNEALQTSSDIRYDLTSSEIEVDLAMTFDAGRERIVGADPEIALTLAGPANDPSLRSDLTPLSTFLGMRTAERKEREYQAQTAAILERQRLMRLVRLYDLKERRRQEAIRKEQERLRLEAEARDESRRKLLEQLREQNEQGGGVFDDSAVQNVIIP